MKCQSKPKTPMFGQGDTITTITDVIMVAEEAGTTEAQPKTDAIKGATTTTKKKKYDESDDDEDFDDDFEEPPPKKRAATAKKSKTGRTDDSDSDIEFMGTKQTTVTDAINMVHVPPPLVTTGSAGNDAGAKPSCGLLPDTLSA